VEVCSDAISAILTAVSERVLVSEEETWLEIWAWRDSRGVSTLRRLDVACGKSCSKDVVRDRSRS